MQTHQTTAAPTGDAAISNGAAPRMVAPPYKRHPLAEQFLPTSSNQERAVLKEDIRARGLLDRTITIHEGKILDGWDRYLVTLDLDEVEPEFVPFEGDDPVGFIVGKNICRRHLTGAQRRMIVEKVIVAKPDWSCNALAKLVGVSDKTIKKIRGKLVARSESPNVVKVTDTKGRKQPATKAVNSNPPKDKAAAASKLPKQPDASAFSSTGCAPNAYGERSAEALREFDKEHQAAFVNAFGIAKLMALANPEQVKAAQTPAEPLGPDAEALVRTFYLATQDQREAFVNDPRVGLRTLVNLASEDQLHDVQSIFDNRRAVYEGAN